MTDFRVVTAEELCPFLTTLNELNWPVSYETFPEVFNQLGWEKQRRTGGVTSLPVSLQIVSVGALGGEIADIRFRISDTFFEPTAEDMRMLDNRFPDAIDAVSTCLGDEPTGTPWVSRGVRWELDGERQLNLLQGESTFEIQYWSKRMADVGRFERSRGVDPARTLDDPE